MPILYPNVYIMPKFLYKTLMPVLYLNTLLHFNALLYLNACIIPEFLYNTLMPVQYLNTCIIL